MAQSRFFGWKMFSSLVAFNMARQVEAVHLFTIVSALELQVWCDGVVRRGLADRRGAVQRLYDSET